MSLSGALPHEQLIVGTEDKPAIRCAHQVRLIYGPRSRLREAFQWTQPTGTDELVVPDSEHKLGKNRKSRLGRS